MVKCNMSFTDAGSAVIQHACEHLNELTRQDSLCGEILAALTMVSYVEIPLGDREAFVNRWQGLLPALLREYGRGCFAAIVEQKLEELLRP